MYITNFTLGVQCTEYSGDQVYRLEVQTPNQIEYLQNLENNGADFWTEVLITINFAPRPSFQILLYSVFSVRYGFQSKIRRAELRVTVLVLR